LGSSWGTSSCGSFFFGMLYWNTRQPLQRGTCSLHTCLKMAAFRAAAPCSVVEIQ
jgi:hypothetical protein